MGKGKLVSAHEYQVEKHGAKLFCIDCKSPIIFISASENTMPHFKTTGKGDSSHNKSCGFARKLSFEESLKKIGQYQQEYLEKNLDQVIIKLNLARLDPDYETKATERVQKLQNTSEIIIKTDSSSSPKSISSLKTVVKLIQENQLELLATIIIRVKGESIPLSQLIISPEEAYNLIKNREKKTPYFVYGTISKFIKREKVYYLNFESQQPFSLVVFEKNFRHFTYTENQLLGRRILAYGYLQRNTYKGERAEMIIKSNKYIELLPL